MNFVKLLNFELKRFIKFWFALALVITALQITAAITSARWFVKYSTDTINREQMEVSEFLLNYGPYTMGTFLNTSFFMMSIMLAAVVIFIYTFFIWYRDWLGKSAFMYRLLMLPSTRLHIYTSKLATIILITLGLTGLQLILLPIIKAITQSIVPSELYMDDNIVYLFSMPILSLLFPNSLLEGVFIYGLGIAFVTMTFTAILCERSFGIRGIIAAVVYVAAGIGVLIIPLFFTEVLYVEEVLAIIIAIAVLLIAISTWLSHYLLTRKITV